jgi:hypothetical protein
MGVQAYPFTNMREFEVWLESTDPTDKYCFKKAVSDETVDEQIERLEYNLSVYKAYMQIQMKFPDEVHEQRKWEFERLRHLRYSKDVLHGSVYSGDRDGYKKRYA